GEGGGGRAVALGRRGIARRGDDEARLARGERREFGSSLEGEAGMSDPQRKSNAAGCPSCETAPFTRNHYFTGKLLVERDFTDEQRYYVEKMRHHNRRLHGWGVVCGLRVHEHDNAACRDRFVCVDPGRAVD